MAGFLTLLIAVALIVVLLRAGGPWASGRRPAVKGERGEGARLDRMETALSLLESRLDDLQDQQRFLERLLADRTDPSALPRPGEASDDIAGPRNADDHPGRSILFDIEPSEEEDGD